MYKKIIMAFTVVALITFCIVSSVQAGSLGIPIDPIQETDGGIKQEKVSPDVRYPTVPTSTADISDVSTYMDGLWETVVVVVQITSMGCIVFTGLRYMFASADTKANIKRGLSYLLIGSILVFATVTVIDLVLNTFAQVIR